MAYKISKEEMAAEIAAAQRVARIVAGLPEQDPAPAIRRNRSPVPRGMERRAQDWHEDNDDPEAWGF